MLPTSGERSPHPRIKIAVVGGGSTYTPELIDGFARLRDALPVAELVLIDPAAERLELIGALARRIFARQGHPGRITWTADLDAGLDGADAVLLQLRVGGQAARNQDETWPLECGCVGQETTGAGGLAKALRTVPVVLDIAERVRRRCPDAWIVDFTNPVGIVTRALLSHGHKAVGLCNVAIGFQRKFAKLLGVAPERVELEHIGLNHLTWERAVRVDGTDVLPTLLARHGDALADDVRMPRALLDHLGVVPSYYLRYYYQHDAVVKELRTKPSRAAEVAAIERQLLDLYADPDLAEKPELLSRRGGAYYSEAAVALTSSLLGGGTAGDVQIVNTLNHGTLPFLPDDAVIEVPAAVDSRGASPLPLRPLAPLFAGLVANVTAYEHLALEAALKGGRDRVFSALLAHPLIGQIDYADRLADELIAHNREHLTWA
ncbi:6-phospho-beta-glucosidase [Streptomyces noursei]|uniref:6-phospho-beta-glucosidase n=1 Tax=Streptomyces noursei TaxID=1971 RepID=UPI00198357EF|nr:6-phospho-beta-glucosidase [Streptomyces noursei]MCZ1015858.1 6-phospho-beta-glucosidase [Streptomyces noursei]GGW91244.1 6-phospho-beta-glucosidase [Streptomyces noursei]